VETIISSSIWNTMNSKISINERAFDEAINAGLAQVWLMLVNEIVKITPRDIERLPINDIDRKDGKTPIRRTGRKPVQVFGHWYEWVTGNLKRSIAHTLDTGWKKVMVGVTAGGPAENYGEDLEYGTAKMKARSYLRKTISDPQIQEKLAHEFERAFYAVLERYNRS
jgi:HK97 gp10 family phage protein